jgi:hypothetical protein
VVGRIGKNTPTAPNPKEIVPAAMNNAFLKLHGLRLPSSLFINTDYAFGLVSLSVARLDGVVGLSDLVLPARHNGQHYP